MSRNLLADKIFNRSISSQDQTLLLRLSILFEESLSNEERSITNMVYLSEKGEIVYLEQSKEPIIGFVNLCDYADEKKIPISENLGKNLFMLEERSKEINNLKIKQLIDVYDSKEPNIHQIIKILNREEKNCAPNSLLDFSYYFNLLNRDPGFLSCYIDAIVHPTLGELIGHLRLFENLGFGDATLHTTVININDHAGLLSVLKNRMIKCIEAKRLIEKIASLLGKLDINNKDYKQELNHVLEMIKLLGKKYAQCITIDTFILFGRSHSKETLDSFLKKIKDHQALSFKQKISISKLTEALDSQPDEIPMTLTSESIAEFNSLLKTICENNLKLVDEMLCKLLLIKHGINDIPCLNAAKIIVSQIKKLLTILDGKELYNYQSTGNGPTIDHAIYTRCLRLGEKKLFKAIWSKIQKSYPTIPPFNETLDYGVRNTMIHFLFKLGAEFPDEKNLDIYDKETQGRIQRVYNKHIVSAAFIACVASEMNVLACYLRSPDVTDLVFSYFRPLESVSLGRKYIQQHPNGFPPPLSKEEKIRQKQQRLALKRNPLREFGRIDIIADVIETYPDDRNIPGCGFITPFFSRSSRS